MGLDRFRAVWTAKIDDVPVQKPADLESPTIPGPNLPTVLIFNAPRLRDRLAWREQENQINKIAKQIAGYLKAVWLEIFGPVFPEISAEIDPRDPPRSPAPARHINFHEKSAPQTNSNAKWW